MRTFLLCELVIISASMFVSCKSSSEDDDLPRPIAVEDICLGMDDEDFKKWCRENYDLNGDGKLSPSEAAAVREFTPGPNNTFSSVLGLKAFTGVEKLDICGTFSDLYISQMSNLKSIIVESNLIEYDLRNNPLLTYISIKNKAYNNDNKKFTLDYPSIIIIGFEALKNPKAEFYGIVKMDEIDLTKSDVYVSGHLIVKNMIIDTKQLEQFRTNGLGEDVIIHGETYHCFKTSNIYWQTVNSN